MNKEQQELLDQAYENYLNKAKNHTTEDIIYNKLSGVGDVIEGMLSAHTRDFIPYSQEQFINKIKTNPDFAKQWGVTIYTVVEDGNIRIGVNYNNETIESYES